MLKFFVFLYLVALASCFYRNDRTKTLSKEKIVGGEETNMKDVPYYVEIVDRFFKNSTKHHWCGGAIISSQWIITAAHCVVDECCDKKPSKDNLNETQTCDIQETRLCVKKRMSIFTGSESIMKGQEHRIVSIAYKLEYNSSTQDSDIALVKVKDPIPFGENQQPIPIATEPPKAGDQMKISGLGYIDGLRHLPSKIKKAIVSVISNEECVVRYADDPYSIITENMFCAGTGGNDSCRGDSGGPAVINGKLSGIVLGGVDCGSTQYPGVYTRLHRYFDWISHHTGLELPKSF